MGKGRHGFLLKAAQNDQTSPGESGDGKSDQTCRAGGSH